MSKIDKHGGRRPVPWHAIGWGGAALLLLAPLVAMQVTDEARWDNADFAMFAAMLLTAGLGFELALRLARNRNWRAVIGIAIAVAFLLIFADAAVGVFPA